MIKHIDGHNDKNSVLLYALSTCLWCKKTEQFLNDLNIKYDYIEVDLLVDEEQKKIMKEIEALNPQGTFPTLVINKTKTIVGYRLEAIRKALV
ncbi:MAG: glutaredoxin family protein [Endomicrobium sp.]|jgi:glutaredoxin|nr:glutaredoxin family protein [Endomicrobium sp.]